MGKFPGCPLVRTMLSLPRARVQALVGELRSHSQQTKTKMDLHNRDFSPAYFSPNNIKKKNQHLQLYLVLFKNIYLSLAVLGLTCG